MHLIKYDPQNLIFNAHLAFVNDTFIQVIMNTFDRDLCFYHSPFFYVENNANNEDIFNFIESIKPKIIHTFVCFKFTDENEGCLHSVNDNNKGWIFLMADSDKENSREFSEKYFMFGDQFDGKDQMIWSLINPNYLFKSKKISTV
jgi:hypothetical protein